MKKLRRYLNKLVLPNV